MSGAAKTTAAVLVMAFLAGCGEWSAETKAEETAYQLVHGADTLQTLQIAHNTRCYSEVGGARSLIGPKPKPEAVLAWGVGLGLAHAGITEVINEAQLDGASPWWQRTWQAATIIPVIDTVHKNWGAGLQFGSSRVCP